MAEERREAEGEDRNRIDIYLDGDKEPLVSYRPPLRFELDTSQMQDGPHLLRVEAYDSTGTKGVREISFTVRNGPGIAISGIRDNDVLEGSIPVLVNSYGGAVEQNWEPSRAETPAPAPTWAWVLLIVFVAFSGFYGVRQWKPPTSFASTPTYGTVAASSAVTPQPAGAPEGQADATGTQAKPVEAAVAESVAQNEGRALAEEPPPAADAAGAATPIAFDSELGASVYGSYCSACHQSNGKGLPGVFPPMAGDPVVTASDPTEHISIVLNGLQGKTIDGVAYASPMPAFGGQLSDEQIAAVISHERSSWGNDAPLVTPEAVRELR